MTSGAVQFSVVIPLFNKAPHIERAIRSVLTQTLPPYEIIVVDDASTDGGAEIVQQFNEVTVLRRAERGAGGYAARNSGIEAASGEWIAFLDADDLWRPEHLATLADAISRTDEGIGCAFTQPCFVGKGWSRPYNISKSMPVSPEPLDLDDFIAAWLDTGICPMWTGAVAIRRSELMAAGLFPAGIARRGGDKDVWLRVMARTAALYVPKVTAEFHQDTVNRVSSHLDHSVQPMVCTTIRRLLPGASPRRQRLLRRLNNMEVTYYARYAAGAGARFNPQSLRTLCHPAIGSAGLILAYAVAGRTLQIIKSAPWPHTPMNPSSDVDIARSPGR